MINEQLADAIKNAIIADPDFSYENRKEIFNALLEPIDFESFPDVCPKRFDKTFRCEENCKRTKKSSGELFPERAACWKRAVSYEECTEVDHQQSTHGYIKVNIPRNRGNFTSGNGEGVWVLVDENTLADWKKDTEGGHYTGMLGNDSVYYPSLKCEMEVPFEMRGENRPVVLYDEFLSRLDVISEEEFTELLRRIAENCPTQTNEEAL